MIKLKGTRTRSDFSKLTKIVNYVQYKIENKLTHFETDSVFIFFDELGLDDVSDDMRLALIRDMYILLHFKGYETFETPEAIGITLAHPITTNVTVNDYIYPVTDLLEHADDVRLRLKSKEDDYVEHFMISIETQIKDDMRSGYDRTFITHFGFDKGFKYHADTHPIMTKIMDILEKERYSIQLHKDEGLEIKF